MPVDQVAGLTVPDREGQPAVLFRQLIALSVIGVPLPLVVLSPVLYMWTEFVRVDIFDYLV